MSWGVSRRCFVLFGFAELFCCFCLFLALHSWSVTYAQCACCVIRTKTAVKSTDRTLASQKHLMWHRVAGTVRSQCPGETPFGRMCPPFPYHHPPVTFGPCRRGGKAMYDTSTVRSLSLKQPFRGNPLFTNFSAYMIGVRMCKIME